MTEATLTVSLNESIPDFTVAITSESTFTLSDYLGKSLIVFFYPKDNTPGCTKEADQFKTLYDQFQSLNTAIVGVSKDSLASHEKFKTKLELPYELIADVDGKVCDLFDVIKSKSMYGRSYLGIERSTFLINDKGILVNEWRKVKVPGHADAVLSAVKAL